MFAFSPPKSYGDSHPSDNKGGLPNKQPPVQIPTPLNYTQPESLGLPPQIPKVG